MAFMPPYSHRALIKGNNLDIHLSLHGKWAVDAMLEAWERVVSTSGARAGARVKVDRA